MPNDLKLEDQNVHFFITLNKNFDYWFSSNYSTRVNYFQFDIFQYRNTRKLKLNIKIKCSYFDIEIHQIENRLRKLRNYR